LPGTIVALAGVVAGVTAYVSVAFLMRWFHQHEVHALRPFAWYCGIAGLAALVLLSV
jgi:undecaprenyl-diphosphatase